MTTKTDLSNLSIQIDKSKSRVATLDQRSVDEKNSIKDTKKTQSEFEEKSKLKLQNQLEEVKVLEDDLTLIRKELAKLMILFKELTPQDAVDHVNSKIDHWPLEQFITKKEFAILLRDYIN